LDPFIGGTGVSRCAYAFIPFALSEERHLVFGFGADYWFEAFLDGDPLYDTLECGNGPYAYYSSNNHVKAARLFKGRHLLAVRVLSGSGGWKLCAGIFTDLEAIK